jgi:hypothetical protein
LKTIFSKYAFEVDSNGNFNVIYVNAIDEELIQESKRLVNFVNSNLITYNGKPTYSKYNITISIPLKSSETIASEF